MADNSMTCREAGQKGGNKRRETADYAALGEVGGAVTRDRYGLAHYSRIGYKGGVATAEKHGKAHYERIGKKGGQRVRELIRKGQAAE